MTVPRRLVAGSWAAVAGPLGRDAAARRWAYSYTSVSAGTGRGPADESPRRGQATNSYGPDMGSFIAVCFPRPSFAGADW
jgi:hypothetical protein